MTHRKIPCGQVPTGDPLVLKFAWFVSEILRPWRLPAQHLQYRLSETERCWCSADLLGYWRYHHRSGKSKSAQKGQNIVWTPQLFLHLHKPPAGGFIGYPLGGGAGSVSLWGICPGIRFPAQAGGHPEYPGETAFEWQPLDYGKTLHSAKKSHLCESRL